MENISQIVLKDDFKSVDSVELQISISIIEHFSKNLYKSASKAIEELVANSYDAAATEVSVVIPNDSVNGVIAVIDNGTSMDEAGLKLLWHIADSPKKGSNRKVKVPGMGDRDVIGKFGIGKLASYYLGDIITYVCSSSGRQLIVTVDYNSLEDDLS